LEKQIAFEKQRSKESDERAEKLLKDLFDMTLQNNQLKQSLAAEKTNVRSKVEEVP